MATKKTRRSPPPSKARSSLAPWLGIAAIIDPARPAHQDHHRASCSCTAKNASVTSFFNLVLAYNRGAAFSFLSNEGGWQRYFFTAIGVVAVVFIIYLLRKHAGQRLFCWALALIMGGAIGNVIDRVAYGHVIDFLDFHFGGLGHFPAFNIADIAISSAPCCSSTTNCGA